jgi:hypothetical protein
MWRSTVLAALCGLAACHGNSGAHPGDAGPSDAGADGGFLDAATFPPNAPPVGGCADGWCWVYPLPQGWSIVSIWGSSASDVWAFALSSINHKVGDGGGESILHFDGSSWTTYAMPAPCTSGFMSTWGTASNDVWASGGCTMHWDGSAWSVVVNAPSGLIGGINASDFWIASGNQAFHWDGTQWVEHDTLEQQDAVYPVAFGGSGTTTLEVSYQGTIEQWTGSAWAVVDASTHPAIAAVVIDSQHLVLAQSSGAISLWASGTWTTQTAPVSVDWTAIAATSLSDVWVAGVDPYGTQVVYHWNGATWSPAGSPTDVGKPYGLWEDPSGAVWVASESSAVSVWNGVAWTQKTMGDNRAYWVWGSDWDNIWTLGGGAYLGTNTVMHWNGSTWADSMFPDPSAELYDGWASGPNDVWIAGGQRQSSTTDRVIFHWNGAVWSSSGALGSESSGASNFAGFTSIWGAAANDIYAVAPTALYHYDGNAWTPVVAVPGGSDVFGSSADDVDVVENQHLWHWDGASWTRKTMPISLGIHTGWANSPTDVWLGPYHYDGSSFVDLGFEHAIGTATDMFTIPYIPFRLPEATEWVGGYGGTQRSAGTLPVQPARVWRTPDGRVFAAGGGLLVH